MIVLYIYIYIYIYKTVNPSFMRICIFAFKHNKYFLFLDKKDIIMPDDCFELHECLIYFYIYIYIYIYIYVYIYIYIKTNFFSQK